MKIYILEYDFLNVNCKLEYQDIYDFCRKLDAIQEMPEVLPDTIVIRTEEK